VAKEKIGLWIPAHFDNILYAFGHLRSHGEVYWSMGSGIKDYKSLSLPLIGLFYLDKKGDIRALCEIDNILPFSAKHYEDMCKKPKIWIERWKENRDRRVLTLVITKIIPFYCKSNKLKNKFGKKFKPAQNCIKIILPWSLIKSFPK
jgi:hypothetical protein